VRLRILRPSRRWIPTGTTSERSSISCALFEDNQANFIKFFHADIEKWKNLVKSTNLKLE